MIGIIMIQLPLSGSANQGHVSYWGGYFSSRRTPDFVCVACSQSKENDVQMCQYKKLEERMSPCSIFQMQHFY